MFQVANKQCENCLLGPNALVSPEAVRQHLKTCREKDCHFICHKASMEGKDICCRGFYDTQTSNLIRVMQRIGGIEFVELPEGVPVMSYKEMEKR